MAGPDGDDAANDHGAARISGEGQQGRELHVGIGSEKQATVPSSRFACNSKPGPFGATDSIPSFAVCVSAWNRMLSEDQQQKLR